MGNLSCGCSDTLRDDTLHNIDHEEILEFQSDLFPHPTENPVQVVQLPLKPIQIPIDPIEGELFRYQKTSKEIFIPRWCVLFNSMFKYYKSHYSALSKEKPLFEISVEKLNFYKFYKTADKMFMELNYTKNNAGLSSSSSVSSISSRPSLIGYKHGRTPSNLSLCDETIVFVIQKKEDWENWKKVFEGHSKAVNY